MFVNPGKHRARLLKLACIAFSACAAHTLICGVRHSLCRNPWHAAVLCGPGYLARKPENMGK